MKFVILILLVIGFTSCNNFGCDDKPILKMDAITTISCMVTSHKVRCQIVNIINAFQTKDIYTIFGVIVNALPDLKAELIRCLQEDRIRLSFTDIIYKVKDILNKE